MDKFLGIKTPIRLAIVGSRELTDYAWFRERVEQWIRVNGRPEQIISGGARGADTLAKQFADEEDIFLNELLADWSKGDRAGPMRNTQIVNSATHVLAFPSKSGRGTQDTIAKARRANKKVVVHQID